MNIIYNEEVSTIYYLNKLQFKVNFILIISSFYRIFLILG